MTKIKNVLEALYNDKKPQFRACPEKVDFGGSFSEKWNEIMEAREEAFFLECLEAVDN